MLPELLAWFTGKEVNRRKFPRLRKPYRATYTLDGKSQRPAIGLDISGGGACVCCPGKTVEPPRIRDARHARPAGGADARALDVARQRHPPGQDRVALRAALLRDHGRRLGRRHPLYYRQAAGAESNKAQEELVSVRMSAGRDPPGLLPLELPEQTPARCWSDRAPLGSARSAISDAARPILLFGDRAPRRQADAPHLHHSIKCWSANRADEIMRDAVRFRRERREHLDFGRLMRSKGKTALITGITGQDGSYLAEFLPCNRGYRVVGMTRRSSTDVHERIEHIVDKVEIVSGDLLDQSSITTIVSEVRPDEIYNLAAQSFVPTSWTQPVLTGEFTALGVTRVLEAIRAVDASIRFYQASSSEMFGMVRESPQTELTPFHPRSPYGVAKVLAVHYITVNYRESYDIFATSGICFNHESPRRGSEFVTRKISDESRGSSSAIATRAAFPGATSTPNAKRDWGYALDYVEAMWMMLQVPAAEDYVIATGRTHSVRDFVRIAFGVAGLGLGAVRRRDRSALLPAGRGRHSGRRSPQSGAETRLEAARDLRRVGRDDGARRSRPPASARPGVGPGARPRHRRQRFRRTPSGRSITGARRRGYLGGAGRPGGRRSARSDGRRTTCRRSRWMLVPSRARVFHLAAQTFVPASIDRTLSMTYRVQSGRHDRFCVEALRALRSSPRQAPRRG